VRLFLDANILFSAAHSPRGGARELLYLAEAGHCELVTSQHAIFEAERNLKLKSPTAAGDFSRVLKTVHRVPGAGPAVVAWARGLELPENDAPILAAAAAAGADLLVTGDRRHFGHLYGTVVGRVLVVTLVEALETLVES
jgi:predicted nucleic acid-binding protein